MSALIAALALVLNAITIFLAELRRRESTHVRVSFRYKIDRQRDVILFPAIVKDRNLRSGQRVAHIAVTYHGRHTLKIASLNFEIVRSSTHPVPYSHPASLLDGQKAYYLFDAPHCEMDDVTAFILDMENGARIIVPVHRYRRLQYWCLVEAHQIWAYNALEWLRLRFNTRARELRKQREKILEEFGSLGEKNP